MKLQIEELNRELEEQRRNQERVVEKLKEDKAHSSTSLTAGLTDTKKQDASFASDRET